MNFSADLIFPYACVYLYYRYAVDKVFDLPQFSLTPVKGCIYI